MAKVFASLGAIVATLGAGACVIMWLDEPEIPESLVR